MDFITWVSHWLLHELWLTGQELQHEITIPRIVTGMVGYGIVHGGFKFITRETDLLDQKRRMAMLHIKKRHDGRFSHCNECRVIQRRYLTQPPTHQQP